MFFETAWKKDYSFFIRYNENGVSFSKKVNSDYEWFEEYPKGQYSYFLDESIKLQKITGNVKNAKTNYNITNPIYKHIRDNFWAGGKYNTAPRIFYLDIETRVGTASNGFPHPDKALEPICLMQIYDSKLKTMFVLGVKDWKHQENYNFPYNVKYVNCKDEVTLLKTFLKLFKKLNPLIVYAWNGDGFDYPYIFNRLKNLDLDTNDLSNYGDTKLVEKNYKGQTTFKLESNGHHYIDLIQVYRKFILAPRASYSLENIANVELNKSKIQHTEYEKFDDFFLGNYRPPDKPNDDQKNSLIYKASLEGDVDKVKELGYSDFVYYGITDTYLLYELDEKINLTNLIFMIAKQTGTLITDSLGTVKSWSQYIANKLYKEYKVTPDKKEHDDTDIVGGAVLEPAKGLHKWVISVDVDSMYPLLGMVGFNMSPETYVPKHQLPGELRDIILQNYNTQDETEALELGANAKTYTSELLKENNLSLSINGSVFKQTKVGVIPEMVTEIYGSRSENKKLSKEYQKKKALIEEIIGEKNAGRI